MTLAELGSNLKAKQTKRAQQREGEELVSSTKNTEALPGNGDLGLHKG
jgi:hypothetical protein